RQPVLRGCPGSRWVQDRGCPTHARGTVAATVMDKDQTCRSVSRRWLGCDSKILESKTSRAVVPTPRHANTRRVGDPPELRSVAKTRACRTTPASSPAHA